MPWKLLSSAEAYLFDWLGTYSIFLGRLAGLYIADYYIYRRKVIDLDDLFVENKAVIGMAADLTPKQFIHGLSLVFYLY